MILERKFKKFNGFKTDSYITTNQLLTLLDVQEEFKDELINLFKIDVDDLNVIPIGNAKSLIKSIVNLDSKCEKIDIDIEMKDLYLLKMLEAEKAIFEIFSIKDKQLIKKIQSDRLEVETRYSSKLELLDYYDLNKFANYCRDRRYFDLIEQIKDYLRVKNSNNRDKKKLRLIYNNSDRKYYLRALTSTNGYKNFGINFSVFIALKALGEYVENTKNEISISYFSVDDSKLYVTFALSNKIQVKKDLDLMFELILENDEIKRNAVSFNGMFKLIYSDGEKESELFIKPRGVKKDKVNHPIDLLTYQHRGNVGNVFEKIKELPKLIDFFIEQVSKDAKKIAKINSPDEVRKFISGKIKYSKKEEFKKYRDKVFNKLMNISTNNTFKLFELLRNVEDLFEHDDIIARDYWRTKLYESLIERK